MKELFDHISRKTSKIVTSQYSTSFSLGINMFSKRFRDPIRAIYGFVRLGDEIVDTFHEFGKEKLLDSYRKQTYEAIEEGISLNPLLNNFQHTVNSYGIEKELIDLFFQSMEMDLNKKEYDRVEYERYILGSAEVVGLMCLRVVVEGDGQRYEQLKPYAMSMGSALQKINFLRDLRVDYNMGRVYFPGVNMESFTEEDKKAIEDDIEKDLKHGYEGIMLLPSSSRRAVYLPYRYFAALLKKIRNSPVEVIMNGRVRIPNAHKYWILITSFVSMR